MVQLLPMASALCAVSTFGETKVSRVACRMGTAAIGVGDMVSGMV